MEDRKVNVIRVDKKLLNSLKKLKTYKYKGARYMESYNDVIKRLLVKHKDEMKREKKERVYRFYCLSGVGVLLSPFVSTEAS